MNLQKLAKKQNYQRNWEEFNEIILPRLQDKYDVTQHNWMFKIRTQQSIFNYYPKGERLEIEVSPFFKNKKKWNNNWLNMSLGEFEENFVLLTPP